ncbi:MAG: RagB/SusD family nutrient uptake outer membrane protein [Bacteroides sp.]|nr:RagB/SusD family nutrient uptake outer membrane protein [Bacteroides sp.]
MKKNTSKIIQLSKRSLIITIGTAVMAGCSVDFLKPDPLSFYEPTNTFSTKEGIIAALASCDRQLKQVWTGRSDGYADASHICTEYMFSDVAVSGTTDKTTTTQDIISQLDYTTTSAANNNDTNRILWFWEEGYDGIKFANSVITYIDQIEELDETTRLTMLGRAYFHQAFHYFNLCMQFKDIPLMTKLVEVAKFDYRSTKREVILEMITEDLKNAVE